MLLATSTLQPRLYALHRPRGDYALGGGPASAGDVDAVFEQVVVVGVVGIGVYGEQAACFYRLFHVDVVEVEAVGGGVDFEGGTALDGGSDYGAHVHI